MGEAYYKLRNACAPFPYPYPERLARYRSRMEDKATKAFERAHGIKRPRKRGNRSFGSAEECFEGS